MSAIVRTIARRRLETSLRTREAEATSTLITDVLPYVNDPVGYARDVLGFEPWDDGTHDCQAMFMASIPFANHIAVRSGHKTGKTGGLACIAWWWFDTRIAMGGSPKVIMTAPTGKQVSEVIWPDVRRFGRHARRKLPGRIFISSSSGVRGANEAKIIAYMAKSADAFSGPSSADMLIIVDEAAGIDASIYDAIEGMAATGATIIFTFNPTAIVGPAYDAFHKAKDQWLRFHFDSEKLAEHLGPRESRPAPLRALANKEWVEERKRAWGENDARYLVRVKGTFPTTDTRAAVPAKLVTFAMSVPWPEQSNIRLRQQRVELGIDVARYGDDKSAIAIRQGGFMRTRSWGGIGSDEVVANAMAMIAEAHTGMFNGQIDTRLPKPIVRIDSNGVGAAVVDAFRRHPDRGKVTIVEVNASQRAIHSHEFANARAEGAFRLRDWLERGGVMEQDDELREDIAATLYKFDRDNRLLIEPKDDIKAKIGRSPDRGDAAMLSVYDTTVVAGMTVQIKGL